MSHSIYHTNDRRPARHRSPVALTATAPAQVIGPHWPNFRVALSLGSGRGKRSHESLPSDLVVLGWARGQRGPERLEKEVKAIVAEQLRTAADKLLQRSLARGVTLLRNAIRVTVGV